MSAATWKRPEAQAAAAVALSFVGLGFALLCEGRYLWETTPEGPLLFGVSVDRVATVAFTVICGVAGLVTLAVSLYLLRRRLRWLAFLGFVGWLMAIAVGVYGLSGYKAYTETQAVAVAVRATSDYQRWAAEAQKIEARLAALKPPPDARATTEAKFAEARADIEAEAQRLSEQKRSVRAQIWGVRQRLSAPDLAQDEARALQRHLGALNAELARLEGVDLSAERLAQAKAEAEAVVAAERAGAATAKAEFEAELAALRAKMAPGHPRTYARRLDHIAFATLVHLLLVFLHTRYTLPRPSREEIEAEKAAEDRLTRQLERRARNRERQRALEAAAQEGGEVVDFGRERRRKRGLGRLGLSLRGGLA